ncbi:MAG: antibiotic biosynthesis monooxygenase [Steroidobacteraceae bacterium]
MARITFVSRMTVKKGREAEFVRICKELAAITQEREPYIIWFEFFKLREPQRYCVVESFANEEDEHKHMSSSWLADYGPRIADCVEGTWVREYLDPFEV